MAKGNSRKKGKGKSKGRKSRKSKAKSRYSSLVRKYGKERAHEMTFGPRKGKHRKGKKGKGKKGNHRKGYRPSTRSKDVTSRLFAAALADVQEMRGTTGKTPTHEELVAADYLADDYADTPLNRETTEKERLRSKISAEKRKLVDKIANEKLREAEREFKAELKDKAKREAEAELRDI